jgi:hypothetical protein
MYSTPVLQVAQRFGARDITESRLLKYDIICEYVGRPSGLVPIVKRERGGEGGDSLHYGKLQKRREGV